MWPSNDGEDYGEEIFIKWIQEQCTKRQQAVRPDFFNLDVSVDEVGMNSIYLAAPNRKIQSCADMKDKIWDPEIMKLTWTIYCLYSSGL